MDIKEREKMIFETIVEEAHGLALNAAGTHVFQSPLVMCVVAQRMDIKVYIQTRFCFAHEHGNDRHIDRMHIQVVVPGEETAHLDLCEENWVHKKIAEQHLSQKHQRDDLIYTWEAPLNIPLAPYRLNGIEQNCADVLLASAQNRILALDQKDVIKTALSGTVQASKANKKM